MSNKTYLCDPERNSGCNKRGCGTVCTHTHTEAFAKEENKSFAANLKENHEKIEGKAYGRKSKATIKAIRQDESVLPVEGLADEEKDDSDSGSLSMPGDEGTGEAVQEPGN